MGWRKTVHKLTGLSMCRHFTLSRGEVRIEFCTGPDGETLEHAARYDFGKLTAELYSTDHDEIISRIKEWTGV